MAAKESAFAMTEVATVTWAERCGIFCSDCPFELQKYCCSGKNWAKRLTLTRLFARMRPGGQSAVNFQVVNYAK